jgi:hypothetical protein
MCGNKAEGHKDVATASNTVGGSDADKGWNTRRTLWCGMANLTIIDNFISCNNNYYSALSSEYAPNPPPTILPSHTGIAHSGASGFYFAPDAPVTNYNSQAP